MIWEEDFTLATSCYLLLWNKNTTLFRHIAEHLTPMTIMSCHSRSKTYLWLLGDRYVFRQCPCRDEKKVSSFPQTGSTPIYGMWPNLRLAANQFIVQMILEWRVPICYRSWSSNTTGDRKNSNNKKNPECPSAANNQATGCNLTAFNGSNTDQGTQVRHRPEHIDRSLLTMWFHPPLSSLGHWVLLKMDDQMPCQIPWLIDFTQLKTTPPGSYVHTVKNPSWTSQPSLCIVWIVHQFAINEVKR